MPSTAHRASDLILRSACAGPRLLLPRSCRAMPQSLRNPAHCRRTIPLSIQRVARVSSRKKARSWLIRTKAAFGFVSTPPQAKRSPRYQGGWSARPAASGPAPRPSAWPRPRAAAPRPTRCSTGRSGIELQPFGSHLDPVHLAFVQLAGREFPKRGKPCHIRFLFHVANADPRVRSRGSGIGSTNPAITFIKVDLPDPLRPTSATLSPGWITSERS